MKQSNRRSDPRPALLLVLAILASPVHATLAPSYPLAVSKADWRMLEQLACIGPHGVAAEKIVARTLKRGDPSLAYASVQCKSHGMFRQKPMSYAVSCEVTDAKWRCSEGNLHIVVPVDDREIRVSPGKYEPGFAYDTIGKVAGAGSFQGYELAKVMKSACGLSPGAASEWIDIQCDEGVVVTISSWCPQSECPRIVAVRRILF